MRVAVYSTYSIRDEVLEWHIACIGKASMDQARKSRYPRTYSRTGAVRNESVRPGRGEIPPADVPNWAARLGISPRRLRKLMRDAGPRIRDVQRALRELKH